MRVGYIKQIVVVIFTLFFCTCRPSTNKEQEKNNIEIVSLDTISSQIESPADFIVRNVPSVEDTVRLELGGKLYFHHSGAAPTDSITVINAMHHYYDGEVYRTYEFIVHNKKSPFHSLFTSRELDKSYRAYFEEGLDKSDWRYSKEFVEYYHKMIEEQKEKADKISINKVINKYTGYWIYLTKYKDQFYIDDQWAWLPSFRIANGILDNHYMDGVYPSVIEQFKEDEDGSFHIKLVSTEWVQYKLIDAQQNIYQGENGVFVVPAKNAHKFEIIEYANNTGDLIP